MVLVEPAVEIVVEISHNATRNGYGHAQYVDGDEDLVLHHASQGDKHVILDHVDGFVPKTTCGVVRLHGARQQLCHRKKITAAHLLGPLLFTDEQYLYGTLQWRLEGSKRAERD